MILAAFVLAAPGVVELDGPAEAAGNALALGLASLRVPLEAGDVQGTFAPLAGLALTLWGLASAARKVTPGWPEPRAFRAAVIGLAFAGVAAGAAAAAAALSDVEPSTSDAANLGLLWGAVGTWLGTIPSRARPAGRASLRRLHASALRLGSPALAPGLTAALVSAGLAGAWFLVAAVVQLAGAPPRVFAGGMLLALAAGPNAAVGLVAVGLGAPVDAVLSGTALADPLSESLSLWDWAGGVAPPHVLLLVLAPAAGVVLGGRAAAGGKPSGLVTTLVAGARNGAVMGGALVAAGWVGSLGATAAAGAERVSVRLGFPALAVFGLALAWGVVGAVAGRSRVTSR